jgi:ATP-dependent Clp protease ATP-binding subunit ClpA
MTDATTPTWFDWAKKYLANWKAEIADVRKPFTPEALQVIDNAAVVASFYKHQCIRAEHLLTAFLESDHANVPWLTWVAGLELPGLWEENEAMLADLDALQPQSNTPHLCRIVDEAKFLAKDSGKDLVDTGHLLLALFRLPNGIPAGILEKFPIDLEQASFAVVQEMQS